MLSLAFTDLLPFSMAGEMLGSVDPKGIEKLDFALSAVLEQKILDFLVDQATQQLRNASAGTQEGVENAKARLQVAQETHQRGGRCRSG